MERVRNDALFYYSELIVSAIENPDPTVREEAVDTLPEAKLRIENVIQTQTKKYGYTGKLTVIHLIKRIANSTRSICPSRGGLCCHHLYLWCKI